MKINPTILALTFGLLVEGLPTDEQSRAIRVRRQDIDFDLADNSPDPVVAPDNSTDYNQQAAIQEVKNDILADPLTKRDIIVSTSSGYTSNVQLNGAAINAPLNCNGAVSFCFSTRSNACSDTEPENRTLSWARSFSTKVLSTPIFAPLLAGKLFRLLQSSLY